MTNDTSLGRWVLGALTVYIVIGLVIILAITSTVAIWILLGLAVGCCVYCYVMLVQKRDESRQRQREAAKKPLQMADPWEPWLKARHRYNHDIEQWMSPEELRQRRGF